MFAKLIFTALAAATFVSAHGKVAVVIGDLGGNGTALGIKGAVVPGLGPNYETEVDTTVFWSKEIATDDDIGYTEDGSGNNQLSDLTQAMALSGSTLPQVSKAMYLFPQLLRNISMRRC
jgi:Egh16-like virulence factor